jgi:type IV pilus assembly protein PilV
MLTMRANHPRRCKAAASRRGAQRGMLLIEMLVAVLLLSLGLLGLVGLQSAVVANSINAEDRTQAALLANELVSTMWAQGTVNVAPTDYTSWQTKVSNTMRGVGATGTAAADPNNTGVTLITITWKAPTKKATDPSDNYRTQVVLQ